MVSKGAHLNRRTLFAILASSVLAASPALASVLDICDVTAKVHSMEEVSVLGAGSKKIVSERDPTEVRFNSFVTMMTLEVLRAIPYAAGAECSLDPQLGLQKVLMNGVPYGFKAGDEIKLMRELYVDLTPEGVSYQLIWSVPIDR